MFEFFTFCNEKLKLFPEQLNILLVSSLSTLTLSLGFKAGQQTIGILPLNEQMLNSLIRDCVLHSEKYEQVPASSVNRDLQGSLSSRSNLRKSKT